MSSLKNASLFASIAFVLTFSACDDDNERSNLRPSIDYTTLTNETPYSELFVDADGNTTVDLSDGQNRLKMFQALNYYSTSSVAANAHIEEVQLNKLFTNTGAPFVDINTSTISIVGADLNNSAVQLRDVVASSRPAAEAEEVRSYIEGLFLEMEEASHFVDQVASAGQPGKLSTYLVDAKGIEIAQVIQKSLIGALQLDYISNVLLDEGLTADNYETVGDRDYTQLEHNWDVAYGLLTNNSIYLLGATDDNRNTVEFGAGAYIWEYNKADYAKIYPAFLKGRAAIVNNDHATLHEQAMIIRTAFEKAIANASLGYLEKWKTGTSDAARAHAIAEGLGFIYSLRFATLHEADASFSDDVLNDLIDSTNGFWDLTVTKINAASTAIKTQFNIQ